jgi:Rod binding domain-containing protein
MALARKKATTIALDHEDDKLLTRAARERGVSRAELIRQQLSRMLEQYRRHAKPASAGAVRALRERGNERELFGGTRIVARASRSDHHASPRLTATGTSARDRDPGQTGWI